MNTTSFTRVLKGAAGRCGLRPELSAEDAEVIRQGIEAALEYAWNYADWTDWTVLEERKVAPEHLSNSAYSNGFVVYDSDTSQWYQSQMQQTSGHALTDETYWKVVTPRLVIPRVAADRNEIGDVLEVWDADYRDSAGASQLEFRLTQDGIDMIRHRSNSFWVKYRLTRRPLDGELWDVATTYAVGDQVYYQNSSGTGDYYYLDTLVAAGTEPGDAGWVKIEIPKIFEATLSSSGAAQWLNGDGQGDKARSAEARAIDLLNVEVLRLHQSQAQSPRVIVRF